MKNQNELISSNRLFLRRFTLDDAEAVYNILSDGIIARLLQMEPLSDVGQAKDYLTKNNLSRYAVSDGGELNENGLPVDYRFAICLADKHMEQPVIGRVGIASTGDTNNVGFYLLRSEWGKGYASEATSLLIKLARDRGYDYLTGRCFRNNRRSARALLRSGMTYRYSWLSGDASINDLFQIDLSGKEDTYARFWRENPDHWIEESVGVWERDD